MFSRLRLIQLCPVVACVLWALLSPVCAGTVHLKNGRVIRGPIVERGDEGVVVEIAGGRMRIYKRFIAAVVYDGSDQADTEKSPAPQQKLAGHEQGQPPAPATRDLPGEPGELLQRLGETTASRKKTPLVRPGASPRIKVPARKFPGGGEAGKLSGEDKAPLLGEYLAAPVPGVSIQPPAGWKIEKSPSGLRFVDSRQGAFRASIELLALPEAAIETGECLRVLRQEHQSILEDCETVDESFSRNSTGGETFRMTSQGKVQSEAVTVHQTLIRHGSHFWLLSGFRNSYDMATGQILAQSIASLRFAAREEVSGRR